MLQYIIVALIMLASAFFLLRTFVFKPKKTKHDCSSGCGYLKILLRQQSGTDWREG